MSIRLRLTVWYTALLGLILLVIGTAIYVFINNALINDVQSQLESQARSAVSILESEPDPMSELAANPRSLAITALFSSQVYVQVITMNGRPFQRSPNLTEVNQWIDAPDDLRKLNLDEKNYFYNVKKGNATLRIHAKPIHARDGKVVGILLVGQSLSDVYAMLARVQRALLVSSVLGLLCTAIGGAFLARSALQQIDEITETARRIGRTEHLAERIIIRKDYGDEISRLTETFNEMLGRLDHLFQTQQRLVGDVSHELRTPLTTIRGNLDLLKRGAINDPDLHREALSEIESEVNRMTRMVGDLLLLAQADSGLGLQRAPVELDTLLLEVFRQGVGIAQGKVELRLGDEDQAVVQGDADRLRQLLLNLVENAIRYTPDGGKVVISLYREENWVRIEVADTGIGISEKDLPHIFDRFYRADRARTRALGGSGLGLAIARWIARAHGGEIEVKSDIGKGSTFTVRLPFIESHKV